MLPVAGSVLGAKEVLAGAKTAGEAEVTTAASFMAKDNIFRSIGVEPIINCRGTFTIIGGSIERPAVREAMDAASHNFVQYDELADGIGQRLAELTQTEWGMVSSGCAAGLKHVTAACVTGGNPERLIRIPNLTGFEKNEVIIPRYSRNDYDHGIRNIGVKIVTVNTREELEKAIGPKTAMIYLTAGSRSATGQPMSLEVISAIAKPHNVPVLIDAAAENLTVPPIHLKRGATIVAYSGGKAICGPQCAGLLLGDKKILMSAWQASSPHHGPGRDNKVGREEMIGMLAAVEDWTKRDHDAEWKRWLGWLDTISKKLATVKGVRTLVHEPEGLSNKSPVLNVIWKPEELHLTGEELAEIVGRSKPRIALGSNVEADGSHSVNITTGQMQPGEEVIVANRLAEVLSAKRSPKPKDMAAPAANLTGKWKVNIEFFSSTSEHSFDLKQDGNWIEGSHKGDLDTRDVSGTIEGNTLRLRSHIPMVGNTIVFLFDGKVSGDALSGNIHLGEYRTAKFTATRVTPVKNRRKVFIPGGPPLAT